MRRFARMELGDDAVPDETTIPRFRHLRDHSGQHGCALLHCSGSRQLGQLHELRHGAGRSMSRTEVPPRFTVADHRAATASIECRKDADVIDKTPAAYEPIDAVMAAQSDLIDGLGYAIPKAIGDEGIT